MKATLIGADFKLVDGQSATIEQAVSAISETGWTWQVFSESSGTKTAKVKLSVVLKVDGTETTKDFDDAETNIEVKVNAVGWAQHHWEWVASTLIIPLAGWLAPKMFPGKGGPDTPSPGSRRFADLMKRRRHWN